MWPMIEHEVYLQSAAKWGPADRFKRPFSLDHNVFMPITDSFELIFGKVQYL